MDKTGKKNGRGAYICPNEACLQKVLRSGSLKKSLGAEIPENIRELLAEAIGHGEG